MTYNEVKQRTYDILCMSEAEIIRMGYATKVPAIFNEAMFRLAQSITPYLREYIVKIHADNLPARITMPPDFISFADEQVAYINGEEFCLTNFIGSDGVLLFGTEVELELIKRYDTNNKEYIEYSIFYNALYPKLISKNLKFECYDFIDAYDKDAYELKLKDTSDAFIPDIAGQIVPHYIAAQLLVLDDKVRSIEEMNEFETLLSVVNDSRHERPRKFHSVRGWY